MSDQFLVTIYNVSLPTHEGEGGGGGGRSQSTQLYPTDLQSFVTVGKFCHTHIFTANEKQA